MKTSLKKRIAFFYLVATAILAGLVFITVYAVVFNTVYQQLDANLDIEISEVTDDIIVLNDRFEVKFPHEWQEREHTQVEVNPTFIQVIDSKGSLLKKTSNLQNGTLTFVPELRTKTYLDSGLSGQPVRQVQMPVTNQTGRILGYILVAVPLEESVIVLANLRNTLLIAFPIVLFLVYLISRFIAGKSISPIYNVIATSNKISNENFDERIELPEHHDEIMILASTINGLLDRLQDAVLREKQFTADASHELRTPLAVIKGTLEVLIRKPRSVEHYENKIRYCIAEVDRMSGLIEQLLFLARYESGKLKSSLCRINLSEVVNEAVIHAKQLFDEKSITVNEYIDKSIIISGDPVMFNIIMDNVLSNAIKYSYPGGKLEISSEMTNGRVSCTIKDYGIGMTQEQTEKIFDRFYRADESRNSSTNGNGLGLAIVKKLSDLQNFELGIKSKPDEGTSFKITFSDLQPASFIHTISNI